MPYPPVVVVDENDNEVGSAMLAEVWQRGLYHRIVSIFVEDDQGRILLQLRGPDVSVYPNRWDQAAGGHVDEGQDYDRAAANEVAEEIGLRHVALTALGTYRSNSRADGRIVNQFERVYVARVAHDVVLRSEIREVSKLQWFTPAELKTRITKHPEEFTAGLLYGLRKYFPAVLA
ncbi:MAG TPA: NUDIX domain-containing protein [Patescibacteria group bacterium]|nr:NUDIX domain-containing protein [Patescibacteria group bacterium]